MEKTVHLQSQTISMRRIIIIIIFLQLEGIQYTLYIFYSFGSYGYIFFFFCSYGLCVYLTQLPGSKSAFFVLRSASSTYMINLLQRTAILVFIHSIKKITKIPSKLYTYTQWNALYEYGNNFILLDDKIFRIRKTNNL